MTPRRLMDMRRIAIAAAITFIATACGAGLDGEQAEPTTPPADPLPSATTLPRGEEERITGPLDRAPAVLVMAGDTELTLEPWTACWGNGCYDGAPPEVLPDIGSPENILVEFPTSGWEFTATVQPVGEECGRRQSERLEPIGDTTHRLVPIGFADDYEVTLFGRGPGGDVFVSFRWKTPTDGVLPVPAATASILADHDGRVDSYGVEVSVWNLAATPAQVTGEVTVTSAGGRNHRFQLTPQDFDCSAGSIFLTAPIEDGLTAAQLGSSPFTYQVVLELDGFGHLGTAVWPDDVDPECDPCVTLTFTPPLPAVGGPSAGGIQPLQIDGVWLFEYEPRSGDDALHGGRAEIIDGCLYVDDAIVVWAASRLDEASAVIDAINSGEKPELLIGGGGISTTEGASLGDLPAVITDRCPTEVIWFGAP